MQLDHPNTFCYKQQCGVNYALQGTPNPQEGAPPPAPFSHEALPGCSGLHPQS